MAAMCSIKQTAPFSSRFPTSKRHFAVGLPAAQVGFWVSPPGPHRSNLKGRKALSSSVEQFDHFLATSSSQSTRSLLSGALWARKVGRMEANAARVVFVCLLLALLTPEGNSQDVTTGPPVQRDPNLLGEALGPGECSDFEFEAGEKVAVRSPGSLQVLLTCKKHYRFAGANTLTCNFSAPGGPAWDNPIPTCEQTECLDPPTMESGYRKWTGNNPGDNATYYCLFDDYELNGEEVLQCRPGFHWSPDPPYCRQIDDCFPNPCENGGECTDGVRDFTCKCRLGFVGKRCQTNPDDCISNPCKNGATCRDRVNGYTCDCPAGYVGPQCGTDPDDCQSNPCKNGATCIDRVNAFVCECQAGYIGELCGTNPDDCKSSPCKNGATCRDQVNGFVCDCPAGYIDPQCGTDPDDCISNPCKNGATCRDRVNGYTCECPAGYVGPQCGTDADDCQSNPCKNGATCTDRVNGFVCECQAGYIGELCGTNPDDCKSSPCKNGATCRDQVNGFVCDCPAGYIDPQCGTDPDDCISNPCKNGATCRDQVNRFVCECPAGYIGPQCGTDPDDCKSNPCKNGATCTDRVNGFVCECQAGYIGELCGTNPDDCKSSPCKNGATCRDQVNGFVCDCPAGYIDPQCGTDPDDCQSNPCKNGATCIDRVNAFVCECQAGYIGELCGTDSDDCKSSPCKNGATCRDQVNGFVCDCPAGYIDPQCGTDPDDCLSSPCRNGATCTDRVNGVSCNCTTGFTGPLCETVQCGTPPSIGNGYRRYTTTLYQDKVRYTCDHGYSMQGMRELVCQMNGQWSPKPPTCEVKCGAPLPADFLRQYQTLTTRAGSPNCGQTAADIIIVCDESASMQAARKERLHTLVERLDESLKEHGFGLYPGIPNQYSLVGFGNFYRRTNRPVPAPHVLVNTANQRVYDISGFGHACSNLQNDGSHEDGYYAIQFALNNITDPQSKRQLLRLREAHIAPIILFISDEDRDVHQRGGARISRSSVKRMIRKSGAQLEAIVDNTFWHQGQGGFGVDATGKLYTADNSGGYTTSTPEYIKRYLQFHYRKTRRDYTSVALELGGAAWDLKALMRVDQLDQSYVEAFVNRTVAMVEQKVHKCCSCQCVTADTDRVLRCDMAAGDGECKKRAVNVFRG
ncbi:fibropellin-1-like [Sycon ciliatum]|uniref:fibropellin-1-like n=1 Tax=Sycon ciliatum TaxID=27933 RepID=UPI0031F6334E